MKLNTNIVMLPEPLVVYDRDQENFFLKVGMFIASTGELSNDLLKENHWNLYKAFDKGARVAEYPINTEGEVMPDECPGRRFITVGPQGAKVDILSRAIKEATYTGFANNGAFSRKLERARRNLADYGIEVVQHKGDTEVDFVVDIYIDKNFDDFVRVKCDMNSDIYGGVIYESETPPPVETLVTDIVNHLNNVAPSICTGRLQVHFKSYIQDEELDYEKLDELVRSYKGFKSSDWEIISTN